MEARKAVPEIEDLRRLQSMSIWLKTQVTQAKIMEWYIRNEGKVCLSFSGGKDSTVLADLTARICRTTGWKLTLVFVDTGLEYPEIRQFVKTFPGWLEKRYGIDVELETLRPEMRFDQVIQTYGYPVISKEVAHFIYYGRQGKQWALNCLDGNNADGKPSEFKKRYCKYKYLLDAPFLISDRCCGIMKKAPLKKYQKESGNLPMIATMAEESQRRQTSWLKTGCNAFNGQDPKSKPMSFWLEQDVLWYIREFKIPLCSAYGEIVEKNQCEGQERFFDTGVRLTTTGVSRTGCMFCMFGAHLEKEPNRFQRMARTHPRQYDYCIRTLGIGEVLDYIGVKYR